MYKLEYAPRAMDDLARVKEYITLQHGADVARKSLRRLTSSAPAGEVSGGRTKPGGNDFGSHRLSVSLYKAELPVLQD